MKKTIWLYLAMILLTACAGQKESGLLVFSASGEDGGPSTELVVADARGRELRRISLPAKPANLFPTRASHTGLAVLQDQSVVLFDAQSGKSQKLEVQGEVLPFSDVFFLGGGRKFVVLSHPRGDTAYLANLESGETTSLIGLNAEIDLALGGRFSPDEGYLAIISKETWLLPTKEPTRVRRIGGGQPLSGFDFSSDSRKIVYTLRDIEKYNVLIETVDGGQVTQVLSQVEPVASLGFAGGKDQGLYLWRDGRVSLLDLESGDEREVLAHEGFSSGLIPAPDGRKMLLRLRSESAGDSYILLDSQTGTAKPLETLVGYTLVSGMRSGSRWLYFVDSQALGEGREMVALDMQTGTTRQVLALDEGQAVFGVPRHSPDGSLALVTVVQSETWNVQQWLVKAQSGEARQLVEGKDSGGMISADNRWLALIVGENNRSRLSLYPAAGGEGKELGEGFFPTWLFP